MKLRFAWHEFRGIVYPACEGLEGIETTHLIFSLLNDDGGLGLEYFVPWLKKCKSMCEDVSLGHSESESFTTELFAAEIQPRITQIHSISLPPETGDALQTAVFQQVIDDWTDFLKRGKPSRGLGEQLILDYPSA